MKLLVTGFVCLAAASAAAPQRATSNKMQAPVVNVVPHKMEKHGHVRVDNYYWLRERDNPAVIAYLEAENRFTEASMAHTKPLQAKLFNEYKTRIKQTDETVPYRKNGYFYYTRMIEGKDYPVFCRKKGVLEASEQVMLDGNAEAAGHKFFSVGRIEVSPENDIMAYALDTVGRRFHSLRFRNLTTGDALPDIITDVTESLAWANDNKTLFYVKQDPETLRPYQVWRHVLGTERSKDRLVFEERDETFNVGVFKTKSNRYIMIASEQTLTSEYHYLDAGEPEGDFKVFEPRRRDHLYSISDFGEYFYIRTNHEAKNFRLMRAPAGRKGMDYWEEVIPHRADVLLDDFEIFKDHLVVVERSNALIHLRVRPWSGGAEHYIDFGEPTYDVSPTANHEFDTPLVRYTYSSLTTPRSVYDYDMKARRKTLLKRDEVLGGFGSGNYVTERLYAPSHDGVKVPISLVYRKGFKKDGTNPLLVYGYGSYGISSDASFNPFIVSLLDRGFVYAIAHIRGGQELGRQWYEDGKLLKKKNTFRDFVACAEYLVKEKYADPKRVYARGGSAGGLLMGAVMNMRPGLFHGIVAHVPYVDVITTMLDDSIPLTTAEYDEWGNPNEQTFYEYMHSYSPYDQVEAKSYPNLLVTTGLHDSQVQYWEPSKWVAKLRALKKDGNRLLLKTEMAAGHGGPSGRYKRYEETAFEQAFLLDLAGIRE